MRKLLFLIALAFASTPALGQPGWETSWEGAVARAQREKRPILLLEMFGRLDEKWC